MEQPNMMPNGMAGQVQGMQRAQLSNPMQNLYNKVLEDVRLQVGQFVNTWQGTHDPRDRANKTMQLITQLRLINPDTGKCLQIAQGFELRSFTEAPNKEDYTSRMGQKLEEILEKRKQNAQNYQNQMSAGFMQQGNGAGMQNMGGNGMHNSGMGNMGFPAGMNGQAGQMNVGPGQNPMFPTHLQRPMQPSPLPMQHQQQQQPTTLNPAALHMNQQQQAQQQQQQQMRAQNMNQASQSQPPNMQSGQGQPGQFPQTIPPQVMMMAKQMFASMSEEYRNDTRQKLNANMSDQQRAAASQNGRIDPLMQMLVQKAMQQMRKRAQGSGAGPQQNKSGMQAGNNSMNVPTGNPQRPPSQADSQNIDFSSILGQQANALKLQESGEQVVPASNNNSNQNAMNQMNMSQGINPQMLGNQMPGGQAMNPAQMQYFFSQQKDREALQKHLMANRPGMPQRQQNGQLHGQPGGLHTPNVLGGAPGQANSPAMSMLNRPMAPPGQATPGTPQSNRQQPVPPTPMTGVNQLAQHHQNMLQNNQQQQQMNQMPPAQMQPQLAALLAKVPPGIQEKLMQMPHAQRIEFMHKYRHTLSGAAQSNVPNIPNMAGINMPNMNMAAPQQPLQQGPNMMQQHMGNAIPGFNSQPPQNQQAMQMDPAQMQSRIQSQQQEMKIKSQAMDLMPFPKPVLTNLGIAVPQQVQRWGDLRAHIQQNLANVPPNSLEKVHQLQQQWFARPGEFQRAMQNLMQQRQNAIQAQQQMQQMAAGQLDAAQQAASMSDRPAPAAQMVPPAPMMQAPTHGPQSTANGGQPRPQSLGSVTPQDIQMYRAKQPQAANWDDNTVRQMILRGRAQMQAQRHAQIHAQTQGQNQAPSQQRQTQTPAQAGPTPRMPHQAGMGTQGASSDQNQRIQQQKPQSSANDDVIEISSQAAKQSAPQAPSMQPSTSQQPQLPRIPQEQLAKMSPIEREAYLQKMQRAQQMQMQSLRNAQGQLGVPNNAAGAPNGSAPTGKTPQLSVPQQEHLKRLYNEVMQANPKGPAVTCDAFGMEKARNLLKKLWVPLQKIMATFPLALHLRYSDERIKEVIRWQIVLQQNAKYSEATKEVFIKDVLAVTPEQLTQLESDLGRYMFELKARQQALASGGFPHQQQTQQAPTTAPGISQQGHVRKASANVKAPPAPTDNKTFDWAAPSPHGIPKYDTGRQELTPDKLKFPPNKKRKTGQSDSQASTPASPALGHGKGQDPDLARKTQLQKPERDLEMHRFRCNEPTCDASVRGFENEALLKQHEQIQHRPIEDPLAFLLDNASSALGIEGPAATEASATKPLVRKDELIKQDQPQIGKANASTAAKTKLAKEAVLDAESGKSKEGEKKEETLWDSLTNKIAMPAPVADADVLDADFTSTDMGLAWDNDLFQQGGAWPSEEDLDASTKEVFDVMNWQYKYCELVDPASDRWELRPGTLLDRESSPELTPASSDSSHASDVSHSDALNFMLTVENFNDQVGVPSSMIPLYHQIKGMMTDDDTTMGNNGDKENAESVEASKKRKTQEADLLVRDFWQNYWD